MQRINSILLASILLMFPFAEPANAANGNAKAKPWMDKNLSAEERTELLLDAMTLDQKIQQIAVSRFNENDKGETIVIKKGGTNKYQSGEFPPEGTLPGCEFQDTGRQIRGIEELGIPTIRMTNGGTGVKGGSCKNDPKATGLPSTLALAATFNRELNYEAGRILGQETRAFAHQVMLGPGMNLVRHPYGGRNYEYFSEDPYLTVGFEKVHLEPGESKRVTVTINKDDSNHPFSYFKPKEPDNLANWADGEWVTADGTYRVHVGGSSADTPLEADVPLVF